MSGRGDSEKPRDQVWAGLDRKFRAPLTAYFHRRLNDWAKAEDLTQEVFVRLTRRPDQNNGETIEAYVFKIAANVLKDWGRHRVSRRFDAHRTLTDTSEYSNLPQALVEGRTPERVLVGKVGLKEIEAALNELSPRTREIFLLSRLENMPYREIGITYGISVSAVEKHIKKAFARLAATVSLS